ncbi:MAG: glycosyltransferase [bacterium]
MTAPAASVVVAAYQAERTLPALLDALRRQDARPPFEVLVVDDGSTDATRRLAEAAGVRVIVQPNAGPAAARNAGWRAALAPVVLFTDSDCVPHADWVRTLAAGLDGDHEVAAGTYGIANPGSWLAETVHAEIVWRHARLGRTIDFAGSYNLAATRRALEQVGGFDERYAAPSGEDNDLSYRLRDAGFRIRFVPAAVVDHHHPTSLARYLREQARHGEWRVVLYARHPRRSRGDDYAGPADLAAPPLAVLSVVLALAAPFQPRALGACALAVSLVIALHTALAVSVALRARSTAPLALAAVGTLRAYARGLGLVRGVLRVLGGGARR